MKIKTPVTKSTAYLAYQICKTFASKNLVAQSKYCHFQLTKIFTDKVFFFLKFVSLSPCLFFMSKNRLNKTISVLFGPEVKRNAQEVLLKVENLFKVRTVFLFRPCTALLCPYHTCCILYSYRLGNIWKSIINKKVFLVKTLQAKTFVGKNFFQQAKNASL